MKDGRLTGMKYVFGASLGKKDGYGDAILSKHPFEWFGNHSIPSASLSRYQAMGVEVDVSAFYGEGKKCVLSTPTLIGSEPLALKKRVSLPWM
jgi:hypothetical protein